MLLTSRLIRLGLACLLAFLCTSCRQAPHEPALIPHDLTVARISLPDWPMTGRDTDSSNGALVWQDPAVQGQDVALVWGTISENPRTALQFFLGAARQLGLHPDGGLPVRTGEVADCARGKTGRVETFTAYWLDTAHGRSLALTVHVVDAQFDPESLAAGILASVEARPDQAATPAKSFAMPSLPDGWTVHRSSQGDDFAGPDGTRLVVGNGRPGNRLAQIGPGAERVTAVELLRLYFGDRAAGDPQLRVQTLGDNPLHVWRLESGAPAGPRRVLSVLFLYCPTADRSTTSVLDLPAATAWPGFLETALLARCGTETVARPSDGAPSPTSPTPTAPHP